jgi:hypothetical protein
VSTERAFVERVAAQNAREDAARLEGYAEAEEMIAEMLEKMADDFSAKEADARREVGAFQRPRVQRNREEPPVCCARLGVDVRAALREGMGRQGRELHRVARPRRRRGERRRGRVLGGVAGRILRRHGRALTVVRKMRYNHAMSWNLETVEIKGFGAVQAWRLGPWAIHERVSRTSWCPAYDEFPEVNGSPFCGYVLTHLPSGCAASTSDDPEELLAVGEDLLAAAPFRMRNWKQAARKMRPVYLSLVAAGRWPTQDIARRQAAAL